MMVMNECRQFIIHQIKNAEYSLAFYRQKVLTLKDGTSEKNIYKIQLIDKQIELEKWKYCLSICNRRRKEYECIKLSCDPGLDDRRTEIEGHGSDHLCYHIWFFTGRKIWICRKPEVPSFLVQFVHKRGPEIT